MALLQISPKSRPQSTQGHRSLCRLYSPAGQADLGAQAGPARAMGEAQRLGSPGSLPPSTAALPKLWLSIAHAESPAGPYLDSRDANRARFPLGSSETLGKKGRSVRGRAGTEVSLGWAQTAFHPTP